MSYPQDIIKNPSAWVPQLYFDLIARVIPGAFLLLIYLLTIRQDIAKKFFFGQVNEMGFAESFLSLTLVLIAGLFVSYVVSVLLWGMLHSVIEVLSRLAKNRFDSETLININPKDLAKKYESIKQSDNLGGSRITKLKAEIHMASTLIAGTLVLMVFYYRTVDSPDLGWLFALLL